MTNKKRNGPSGPSPPAKKPRNKDDGRSERIDSSLQSIRELMSINASGSSLRGGFPTATPTAFIPPFIPSYATTLQQGRARGRDRNKPRNGKPCPPNCACTTLRLKIRNAMVVFAHVKGKEDEKGRVQSLTQSTDEHAKKISGQVLEFMKFPREIRDQIYAAFWNDMGTPSCVQDEFSCKRNIPHLDYDPLMILTISPIIFAEAVAKRIEQVTVIIDGGEPIALPYLFHGQSPVENNLKAENKNARSNGARKPPSILGSWIAPFVKHWELKFCGAQNQGPGCFPGQYLKSIEIPQWQPPAGSHIARPPPVFEEPEAATRRALNEGEISNAFLHTQRLADLVGANTSSVNEIGLGFGVNVETIFETKHSRKRGAGRRRAKQSFQEYEESCRRTLPDAEYQRMFLEDALEPLLSLSNIPTMTNHKESLNLEVDHKFRGYFEEFENVVENVKQAVERKGMPGGNLSRIIKHLKDLVASFQLHVTDSVSGMARAGHWIHGYGYP